MKNRIAPSMMCCDLLNVQQQLEELEKAEADLLHIDIMDGQFVPNIALGACFVKQLKEISKIPLDLHFMVENPERLIPMYSIGEGDYVSVHFEATKHLQRVLALVKSYGAKVLLAINPGTPIESCIDVLDDIDGVLIMTVNPGFAGQKMVPHSIEKIKRTRAFLDANEKNNVEIQVDGNVSIPNAIKMKNAGANIFVLGTAVQSKPGFWAEDLDRFCKEVYTSSNV